MPDFYMQKCIEIAKKSKEDIPVGCIIVHNSEILSSAFNKREVQNSVISHAEILALEDANKKMQNWRLDDCDLYVTLEPCPMCAWAILNARIKNVYFGASDSKYGAFGGRVNLCHLHNFKTKIFGGIMEEECEELIKEYFKKIRK